ncbi:Leucine-rich repeat receptor protein kinase ems1 [Thalictrum thalictroides]|uniref:Leucine-rich repeat receptor protein kinase ems1 n=1 Tax=Thalictrum thalictroides TaxID=46969 RepID=A0A7J6XDR1_THATH|nr:Leucine-rich repeat receptor protein kinase ems1 [Thalictrum thalictroides]
MRFLFILWLLLFTLLSILSYIDHSFASGQCLDDQKSLLLQFKQNLSISVTSKFSSWDSNTDCCSWDGIKCDDGHVISLDLSNKSISGSSDSWSSLYKLKYLISLNLSYNFINSTLPSGLDKLANLTHLNLSNSEFAGQIPIEISYMKRLVSLDLSTLFATKNPLKLENPDLKTLVKDLFELRELNLDGVKISMNGLEWSKALSSAVPNLEVLSLFNCNLSGPLDSSLLKLSSLSKLRLDQNNISDEVPEFFGNFSNLSVLHLSSCNLSGTFPEKIFQLPLLRSLDLSINGPLQGFLPEFPQNGSLENLVLSGTNFSGTLPEFIGNLRFLSKLELQNCLFNGTIPTSMSNLTRLQYVDLSSNNFTGPVPHFGLSENLTQINLAHNQLTGPLSQWGRHLKLTNLNLRNNLINGTIPMSLFSCPILQKLDLCQNRFTGPLSDFSNGSSLMLDTLDLSGNMLEGSIPLSFFEVKSLKIFTLSSNKLNGTLYLDMFQKLRNLSSLDLSGNNITIISNGTNSTLFPQVGTLKLSSCNLRTFPEFLSNQSTLSYLDLSNNQIRGKIPNWIWKIGNGNLAHLNLSSNFLENPDQTFHGAQFNELAVVDLHSNLLQGPIPILPPSASVLDYSNNNNSIIPVNIDSYLKVTIFFSLSHNSFHGEIPYSICKAENLLVLDLSDNSFSGSIPKCLSNISTLVILNLRNNKLTGTMPEISPGLCSLRTLNLNGNKLEGKLSKTLENCTMLEVLDVGNNLLNGIFPCWLEEMPYLRVLVLRANKFNGSIPHPKPDNITFPMLQIIDISSNNFSGKLPSERFLRWKGMMNEEETESNYKHSTIRYRYLLLTRLYYQDAVTVTRLGFGAGAAFVVALLWFWTDGRKWYDKQIDRFLSFMLPSAAFLYDDGRVDTFTDDNLEEEFTEDEELTEHTSNYSDEKDMEGSRPVHGRYCLFCTKVDISTKRVIHNPKCNCHVSPHNSSSIPQ